MQVLLVFKTKLEWDQSQVSLLRERKGQRERERERFRGEEERLKGTQKPKGDRELGRSLGSETLGRGQ